MAHRRRLGSTISNRAETTRREPMNTTDKTWPFTVDDVVTALDGEHDDWPSLATAPVGTTVHDVHGEEWYKCPVRWRSPGGVWLTSVQLSMRGPIVVVSVHRHEWIDITAFSDAMYKSLCAGCGASEESLR